MTKDMIDVIIARLEEAEKQLSDEAYAFLESHEDIDDVMVYQNALLEYIRIIKPQDEQDKRDIEIMTNMIQLINTLVNAMNEMF